MTDIATGSGKRLRYAEETTFDTRPAAGSGKTLRRVSSNFKLDRPLIRSKEVRTDKQRPRARFGSKSVSGTLQGELSCGSYADFIAAALRGAWAAGATSGSQTTLSSNAGTKTITRSAGSFVTDGFKKGDYVESTGSIVTSGNVTTMTATTLTLDGTVPTVAAGSAATVTVVGKKVLVPATGHTRKSFMVEEYFEEIGRYRFIDGLRVDGFDLDISPDSIANVSFKFVGADLEASAAQHFSAASAALETPPLASATGKIYIDGVAEGTITALKMSVKVGASAGKVVGADAAPDVFLGSVDVTGSVSVYFKNDDFLVDSLAETPISVWVRLDDGTGESITIKLPEVKLANIDTNDTETDGLVVTAEMATSKYSGADTTMTDISTIVVQDTTL